MKKYIWMALTVLALHACSDEKEMFDVPVIQENILFTPAPGGAIMNYRLPVNSQIAYIKVRYFDVNGKEVIMRGSYLDTSLKLVGFNGAQKDIPVYISYEDKNGNDSEEVEMKFNTEDSIPYAFFDNLRIEDSWDGFKLYYNMDTPEVTGLADVFYVGMNPKTQQTDTLLVETFVIEKGEHTRTINISQQLDECTVVIRSEDFRGYTARQEVYSNVKSYPTEKLDNFDIIPAEGFSLEDETPKVMAGVKYLTDGDCKGILAFQNITSSSNPMCCFVGYLKPDANYLIVDMQEELVPASVRVYNQFSVREYPYYVFDKRLMGSRENVFPCNATLYGSNDKSSWDELGSFAQAPDGLGGCWAQASPYFSSLEEINSNDPRYMNLVAPLEDRTYRYLKIQFNELFATSLFNPNTNQEIWIQEIEVYVKK